MVWEINATHEFSSWLASLFEEEKLSVVAAVELLSEGGPTLRRPTVERIHSSRYHNMKELRPRAAGKHLRVLFMFDPHPSGRRFCCMVGAKPSDGMIGIVPPSRQQNGFIANTWQNSESEETSQTRSRHDPRHAVLHLWSTCKKEHRILRRHTQYDIPQLR